MKKKILLIETEIIDTGGHFFDNLIESFYFLKDEFDVLCILNNKFNLNNTFLPINMTLEKILFRNFFEKKDNKFLYYLFEFISLILRFLLGFLFIFYFLYKRKTINYLNALLSNNFLIPKYFLEIYFYLKKNNFNSSDNIFFQTARNNDMSLANFLSRIDTNIPKIHLRILHTPSNKKKIGGFYFYLNKIQSFLKSNRIFLYVLTEKNFNLFQEKKGNNVGLYITNIPWVFFKRGLSKSNLVVGYMGDARASRGFNLLPELINKVLKNTDDISFLIQFSKLSEEVNYTFNILNEMSKKNNKIYILKKYLDYKDFRNTLEKINIMPILHNSSEINNGNPSTIYSSITHEIPMIIPTNLKYMNNILVNKSFEYGDNLDDIAEKIIKIKNNYLTYLNAAKKNSSILFDVFSNDPLKKNFR